MALSPPVGIDGIIPSLAVGAMRSWREAFHEVTLWRSDLWRAGVRARRAKSARHGSSPRLRSGL
jgi:hypothetical protein